MLEGEWLLTPIGDGGCRAELTMRFAFKNPLMAMLLEQKFAEIAASLVNAFVALRPLAAMTEPGRKRCVVAYGTRGSSASGRLSCRSKRRSRRR